VLNDNQMSISQNVGAVSSILTHNQAREFFHLFGFDYVGPLDGHDLGTLIGTLQGIRENYSGRPILLHALTQKGKGYAPAEQSPAQFHGVAPEKVPDSSQSKAPQVSSSYSDVFGEAMCDAVAKNPQVVAITAAMPEGTGLVTFSHRYPGNFFDVGIAEPHAATFAAGLATQGYLPVVAIYSTFFQRALDAAIHDVALQKLPVIFALDRAGLVGADGPTHHGSFDLAYLGMISGMKIGAPACLSDLSLLLQSSLKKMKSSPGPVAIRYPRGGGIRSFDIPLKEGMRIHLSPQRPRAVLLSLGAATEKALQTAHAVDPDAQDVLVVSTVWAKPHSEALLDLLRAHSNLPLMTVEEGVVRGGWGESLLRKIGQRSEPSYCAGYPDEFIPHGAPAVIEELAGVSVKVLTEELKKLLRTSPSS
jgi:1-deoxy-D-xylulose-5-phosphate synthase